MPSKILIEICCGSVDDAVEAERGGADRVDRNIVPSICEILGR